MRSKLLLFILLSGKLASSQVGKDILRRTGYEKGIYVSANFFSLAEPHIAFGPAVGYRFTERSEFFLEAAYVARSPFYKDWQKVKTLHGLRTLLQYRYHFLQQGRPLFAFGSFRRRAREEREPFIGLEFRYKPFGFTAAGSFINHSTNDTLNNVNYRASSTVIGGAFIFGNAFNLSRDEHWKLEIMTGIGAKYRYVKIHNRPAGYENYILRHRHMFYPSLPEEGGLAYVPFAIRLRYVID